MTVSKERQWVYARGRRLYTKLKGVDGWFDEKTQYVVGQETEAVRYAKRRQQNLDRERQGDAATPPALTVRAYAKQWLKKREGRVRTVNDERARIEHALARIGGLRLDEVRVSHVRDMVQSLRAETKGEGEKESARFAPRTVLHVYRTLFTMYQGAIRDELVTANPCQLGREDLPKKADRDPAWRPTAIYTADEVETIISDERVPIDRRVLNALLALTGCRFGEVAALRFRAWDRTLQPLGRLSVHASYDKKSKAEKEVKTGVPRLVPVHPTLAAVLKEWRESGWREQYGREPTDDDLVIPSRREDTERGGEHRNVRRSLERFHEDLDRLGLRRRRQHDLRRTFISLAMAHGARKDVLRWVTHGPEGDIVDLYTTLPWAALCDEVAKLRIERREAPIPAGLAAISLQTAQLTDWIEEKSGADGTRSPPLIITTDPSPRKETMRTDQSGDKTDRTAANLAAVADLDAVDALLAAGRTAMARQLVAELRARLVDTAEGENVVAFRRPDPGV